MMIARCVTDLSPGTVMVPVSARPGVMVSDAIVQLHRDRGTNIQFLALGFGSFERLLNTGSVASMDQAPKLLERLLIGIDEAHHVLAIPEENIPPHLRRTG